MEAFAANMFVRKFKWAFQGVILLDVKVNNVVAKAVYDLGCANVASAQYFVKMVGLLKTRVVPFSLLSDEGVKTINWIVFDLVKAR